MESIQCCTEVCDRPLNQEFWNEKYATAQIGWDLGQVSPPLQAYIDQIRDKEIKILIPGCGNAYEAQYLLDKGFKNITLLDIAPLAVAQLKKQFETQAAIRVLLVDFFEHEERYDLIFEQTFFCAIPPQMREQYVKKMHDLLNPHGRLVGLLFNRVFESGPPFGGSMESYQNLFSVSFTFLHFEKAENSVAPRAGTELFMILEKNSHVILSLFNFNGITCNGCRTELTQKLIDINAVEHASISSDFSKLLIVSEKEIDLKILNTAIAEDAKYKIEM